MFSAGCIDTGSNSQSFGLIANDKSQFTLYQPSGAYGRLIFIGV